MAVWDSGLDSSAGDAVISAVMTDNYSAGQECGKRLAKLMNGTGKVLMLRHAVNHDSTTKREEGFLEGLRKAAPSIEFLSIDQRGGVSIDEAMKVSESLLNQFADQIDGVFTPNESTTQGMLRALEQVVWQENFHLLVLIRMMHCFRQSRIKRSRLWLCRIHLKWVIPL